MERKRETVRGRGSQICISGISGIYIYLNSSDLVSSLAKICLHGAEVQIQVQVRKVKVGT